MDQFEIKLIKAANKRGIPILGICRGHQIVNVAFNGTLLQDITLNKNYDKDVIHQQNLLNIPKDIGVHDIDIIEGTTIYSLFGNKLCTNSFHHQAVDKLADCFKVAAYSSDGIIEAYENKEGTPVICVQWHPEKTLISSDNQLCLFQKFVSICKGVQ